MKVDEIRGKYLKFFEKRGHKIISPAPLVLENDPTTLFTSSGMQPLVPYLMGEPHPEGKRLVDSQPSFRAVDIEEVGDNRHTTYFEMLGNWSLGDYFKKEQLPWIWEFLTKELNLPKEKLYVSIFKGEESVPKDEESKNIWLSLGVNEDRVFEYGFGKNWWSRAGSPKDMPAGEIGGPTSEIFYEFTTVLHDPKFGEKCHPNCDCGRFVEIGNSVFMIYRKTKEGLEELPNKNVDFGGGLERILMAVDDQPDIYRTEILNPLLKKVEKKAMTGYGSSDDADRSLRIIAEHMRAAEALIKAGVLPSNKLQGYVLRRLVRRSAVKMRSLKRGLKSTDLNLGFEEKVSEVIEEEVERFSLTLEKGLKEIEKIKKIEGKKAFDLYQTYGFPLEITEEIFRGLGQEVDLQEFRREFESHKEKSRTSSSGVFKGGLADHSEETTRLHTATHLLHAALREILGTHVSQKGSNITKDRLRFDFTSTQKLTEEEIKKVESLVNEQVDKGLSVKSEMMTLDEAKRGGALANFTERYGEKVKVYSIGDFSKEVCGGPHVANTKDVGHVKIIKQEKVGTGILRIYAKSEN